jgi:uncharacterized protein
MIAVHVAHLLKAPVGTSRSIEFDQIEPELTTEAGVRGPLVGTAKLVRTTHGILAHPSYRAEVATECSRCLGDAVTTVESSFSQEFLPSTNIQTGLPDETVSDPDEPRIGADHVLDLTDAIRQDILLQLPLQPRCSPDCAGLCSVCGQDQNEAACEHGPGGSEPEEAGAFGRLGELLKGQLSQN